MPDPAIPADRCGSAMAGAIDVVSLALRDYCAQVEARSRKSPDIMADSRQIARVAIRALDQHDAAQRLAAGPQPTRDTDAGWED